MLLRVTSELWVSALRRRSESNGLFAVIVRVGAAEAGAIFIAHKSFGGATSLYGPAPQSLATENQTDDRMFELISSELSDDDVSAKMERETSFDSDIWVIEIEGDTISELFQVVAT